MSPAKFDMTHVKGCTGSEDEGIAFQKKSSWHPRARKLRDLHLRLILPTSIHISTVATLNLQADMRSENQQVRMGNCPGEFPS